MDRIRRRAGYYLLSIAVLILVSTVLYDIGMHVLEPDPYPPPSVELSIFHSLQVVVETFTATGYGSDAPWSSPTMNIFVVVMDLAGVALVFLALPAVLVPLFQEALSRSPPRKIENGLSDHVIICTYTSRAEILVEELTSSGIEYVLVEPDQQQAISLDEEGYSVVHADPESVEDLERAQVRDARAVVADVSDRVDASIVLATKEVTEEIRVISVIEEPEHESYHRLAGADEVLTPRQLLGAGLAQKITAGLGTDLDEAVEIGETFDVLEIPIPHGSDLAGRTLAESDIREEFGVNVVGGWYRGEFETPPPPNRELDSGTVLLVAGSRDQLEKLAAAVRSSVRRSSRGKTVVVGHGEVGQTVTQTLAESDLPYTVVDSSSRAAVDVVGDATDPEILRKAGVPDASTVVLAIPDDTTTEFATLVVRDLTDSAEIIARADNVDSVRKMYRAGADYVLSLATVSGRSIASQIFETETILSVGTTANVVRTTAPELAGETLRGADIRERTGCTVVAVERNGTLNTVLDPTFEIRADDELVVVGTDAGTSKFTELFT